MQTYAYGFPRLGKDREFKTYIEKFWKGELKEKELVSRMDALEEERLLFYKQYVDYFPIGEFSYYDNILDTSLIFGVYRFKNLKEYFDYARGKKALELKKYFNTNYHYLVPHLSDKTRFKISWNKLLFYFNTFFSFRDQPIFLIGPYTFFKLSRKEGNPQEILVNIFSIYQKLFNNLYRKGVHFLHLEEPALVTDIPQKEKKLIIKAYQKLLREKIGVNLITYYESIDFLKDLYDLPFYSLALDFVTGQDNLNNLRKLGFPKEKNLICGIVDGRGIMRSDVFQKAKLIEKIKKITKLDYNNLFISNSAPLFHLPVTLENEDSLEEPLKKRMSFAQERLYELQLIKKVLEGEINEAKEWCELVKYRTYREKGNLFDSLSLKEEEFLNRKQKHQSLVQLPFFPTTTIGSFPQDKELRRIRSNYRRGKISKEEYEEFIKNKINDLIKFQEEIGLDVLVHGEFERTDMVEFFAQKLGGFITTSKGWIISYGTRVYRPPIIYDRIERKEPLTLKEICYAQSLTSKPVKGIFTGPVTITAWSYNLREVPSFRIAFELAKALNKEAQDLIKNNIKVIQIDEPAIKEYAPLKKKKRDFYFSWAVRAFNLTAKLPQKVQIHTHMCYSEFSDIIKWIRQMNFDVITIEAARQQANILDAFKKIKFLRQIGPGVWDIHSKYPAETKTIENVLNKAIKIFGKDRVWINPDCGLKTREWPETKLSLKRMVKVAKAYRKRAGYQ